MTTNTLRKNFSAPAHHHKTRFFLVMMRLNLKFLLICLCFAVFLITFTLWTNCGGDLPFARGLVPKWNHRFDNVDNQLEMTEEIDCVINQEYTIGCRREGDEIYLPFSFLSKYFEVYGSLNTVDGAKRFDWSHSYGKVNNPKGVYDPKGIFMYFENYNVEMRDRVKCISAIEGVPISTQWESQGYFYATQIAQFGLSHYSKNLTEPEPRRKVVEDGEKELAEWRVPKNSSLSRSFVRDKDTTVVHFSTGRHFDSAIALPMDHVLDLVLSVELLLKPNSSFMVTLQNRETQKLYNVIYILADLMMSVQDDNIYYGLGQNSTSTWKRLTRDLFVDLQVHMDHFNP